MKINPYVVAGMKAFVPAVVVAALAYAVLSTIEYVLAKGIADPIQIWALGVKISVGALGVIAAVWVSRWLDWRGGIVFGRDVLPHILANDPSGYFGRRLLAIAIIMGAAILA